MKEKAFLALFSFGSPAPVTKESAGFLPRKKAANRTRQEHPPAKDPGAMAAGGTAAAILTVNPLVKAASTDAKIFRVTPSSPPAAVSTTIDDPPPPPPLSFRLM